MTLSWFRASPLVFGVALVSGCGSAEDPRPPAPPASICAALPCEGGGGACEPLVIEPNVVMGALSSDAESIVVREWAAVGSIRRLPKPGCSVPLLDVGGLRVEWAVVASDYLAWTQQGNEGTCHVSNLTWCDPRNCDPEVIGVLGAQPEFERLAGLALGDEFLYYMLADGLVGRVARGSDEYEALWVDPAYTPGDVAPILHDLRLHDGRLYFTRSAMGDDVPDSCVDGEKSSTGAVMTIEPVASAEAVTLAADVNGATSLDVGGEYVFFFADDGTLLHRVPRAGGAVEALLPGGELVLADPATDGRLATRPPIEVQGDWVYFGAKTADGGRAIARIRASGAAWNAEAAEVVARPAGRFHFVADEEGVYWIECPTNEDCGAGRLLGRALPP
ncbi:hypothetical protein [Polyangium spumosum]|uniref:DUF5050 domain-containing protein n=1 Tax=Polyangium spumosum TaxID=889282 RepID=A0A6N7PXM6_9BACT|nr:hypothetical protein [Polyangium spumosum]MRG96838.1 hypothetical protein [Polyangium spumosum]